MQVIADEDISGVNTWHGPRSLSGLRFERCSFYQCYVSRPAAPEQRVLLKDIQLYRCRKMGCDLYGAILEDVTVESLTRLGGMPITLAGCAYRHVVLKGPVPQLTFTHSVGPDPDSEHQPSWTLANKTFYDTTDWAIDISEAQFGSHLSLDGIPASLVRRDPTDQVVLTRSGASTAPWQAEAIGAWSITLDRFLNSNQDSLVVVAGKRDKRHYQADLRVIELLRSLGVAQPG